MRIIFTLFMCLVVLGCSAADRIVSDGGGVDDAVTPLSEETGHLPFSHPSLGFGGQAGENLDVHDDEISVPDTYIKAPELPIRGLKTNTRKSNIHIDHILSGGPGKDGIPSIDNPQFTSVADADVDDEVLGMYVELEGEGRFYPYTILVWHEIVNDVIGDTSFAVTFCPLCGSAIVFDREIDGEVVRFGVSGLLFESNLLMYDSKTESLWSQARGDAVVGELTGIELTRLPMQLIPFSELKKKFPNAKVLSSDTGYRRNYGFYPYGDYEESDSFVFDPSLRDDRFHAKKMMYVTPFGEKSLAFPYEDIPSGTSTVSMDDITVHLDRDGAEIEVVVENEKLIGYFEMWFSWAVHHQEDGVVWVP